MQFSSGWMSPYFINNPEKMEAVLDDAFILLYEKRILGARELVPLLEKVLKANRSLLVIAEAVEGEALATAVLNKVKGGIRVCLVKAPLRGEWRKDFMADLAVLTGGHFITEDLGAKLENISMADLGRAKTIRVDKEKTTIIEGAGKKEEVDARIQSLKDLMEKAETDYEREKLQDRLAKLSGGIAVINVGAKTETEMKEKKDRIDDALHATKAAVDEGIVPGGGCAFIRAAKALEDGGPESFEVEDADEEIGVYIVRRALTEPLKQIAINAGKNGETVLDNVLKMSEETEGYNAETDTYEDLIESGVIDPVKVSRTALENAASVASLMLTTEGLISEIKERPDEGDVQIKKKLYR